jgi:hypothetical protein
VKPDWDRIPTKRDAAAGEAEWDGLIEAQAQRDAAYGRAMSGQSEKLLVEYVSQSSPDRRRMYETLFRQYGDRLESYDAGDGSNMRNVDGKWEFELTDAEARLVERFMETYARAFSAARGASGRRLFEDI